MDRKLHEKEAAEQCGVAVNTLRRWRWEGKGPRYLKLGRAVRYKESDLETWLDAQAVEPGVD